MENSTMTFLKFRKYIILQSSGNWKSIFSFVHRKDIVNIGSRSMITDGSRKIYIKIIKQRRLRVYKKTSLLYLYSH